MDLPKGELPILFGNLAIPARTQVRSGYLARPDQRGGFPTVLVVPAARGLNSSLRSRCRSLARYGLAVLAIDLYRGKGPRPGAAAETLEAAIVAVPDRRGVGDINDALRFLQAPQTSWSAPDRIGILGLGRGGRFAVLAARDSDVVEAAALAYTPLAGPGDPPVIELLGRLTVPVLGIYGRADEVAAPADVDAARERLPHARWLLYQDAGHDFLDEDADAFDAAAASDAERRLVGFFLGALAVPGPVAAAG